MKINVDTCTIQDFLGKVFTCDCQRQHATKLACVKILENVKEEIYAYVKNHGYQRMYVIADENTNDVYGRMLVSYLQEQGIHVDYVILQGEVVPNEMAVFQILCSMQQSYDYILGVGAGTINDLSKFISYKMGVAYGIVATAPSMDGFASIGAALITNDLKTTYDCHVPTAIFADLDVLAQAPLAMIQAGLGDMIGKYNCLIDWKIAHLIQDEYYCQTIVDMVYKSIHEVISHADGIVTRDKKAIQSIMEALIATGIAMSFTGNSRPASGSEHHISHYWEMKFLFAHRSPIFHGAKVGIATSGVIALWKSMVKERPDFAACREYVQRFDQKKWEMLVRDKFEGACDGVIALEKKAGKNNIEEALQRITRIETHWEEIKEIIDEELPDPKVIVDLLQRVSAPYTPAQVQIDEQMVLDSVILAKEVRVRYGLLQMLWDLGMLDKSSVEFVNYYKSI